MKIMIDDDVDLGVSYTTIGGGKIVIDIPDSEANSIVKAILEEIGATPIASCLTKEEMEYILEAFSFEDVMNHYGASEVCEWYEANR